MHALLRVVMARWALRPRLAGTGALAPPAWRAHATAAAFRQQRGLVAGATRRRGSPRAREVPPVRRRPAPPTPPATGRRAHPHLSPPPPSYACRRWQSTGPRCCRAWIAPAPRLWWIRRASERGALDRGGWRAAPTRSPTHAKPRLCDTQLNVRLPLGVPTAEEEGEAAAAGAAGKAGGQGRGRKRVPLAPFFEDVKAQHPTKASASERAGEEGGRERRREGGESAQPRGAPHPPRPPCPAPTTPAHTPHTRPRPQVALVRVGEFFETIGTDAVLLVQHAGLNPMVSGGGLGGGRRRAAHTLPCAYGYPPLPPHRRSPPHTPPPPPLFRARGIPRARGAPAPTCGARCRI